MFSSVFVVDSCFHLYLLCLVQPMHWCSVNE